MAKIIKDTEMAEIVYRAVHDEQLIDCEDSYLHFLEELAQLIANHFGGEAGNADALGVVGDDGKPGVMYSVAFTINESVPQDGGIYNDYDKDVNWNDGKEVS